MSITRELPAAIAPGHQWASVRKAVPSDAGAIATVYDEVYRGTYSYTEYVDPAYLSKDISNRWNGWYVIEDKDAPAPSSHASGTGDGASAGNGTNMNNNHGSEVCGCVSGALDPVNGRVYVRGMMVRPGWQGRGGTSLAMGQAFVDFMGTFGPKSRIVWSETRGAEKRALAVCETTGLVPLGILPGKDVFFGRRETAVLMALHSSTAWKTRDATVNIIPEVLPAREHAAAMIRQLRKDVVTIANVPSTAARGCPQGIDVTTVPRANGYVAHAFTCIATGESVEAVENRPNKNAEHVDIHCTSPATASGLLSACKAFLQARGVRYVEAHCPASRPWLQRAIAGAGFTPVGYLPAWTRDPRTGLYKDEIAFAWHETPFNPASIDPTPKVTRLVDALFT